MTQTIRRRANPAARYRGVVYGIDLLDHHTRQVVPNDYVGKTRQRGRARENQHRDDKPWSDLIVGSSHVLWEGMCTEDELDEMERRFIQDVPAGQRPRMNWLLNEDNPRQIPKWVQEEQRREREPGWVPLDQRTATSLLDWSNSERPAPQSRPTRKRRPWKIKAGLWSMLWVVLTAGMWVGLNRVGLTVTWQTEALSASLASAAMCLWGLAGAPITRRQRRAAKRRIRNQWRRWWG